MTTYSWIRSKTVWTIILTVFISVANALVPFISPDYQAVVVTVLGVLAAAFHTNTAKGAGAVN